MPRQPSRERMMAAAPMARGKERTLTAVRSPFTQAETPTIPTLFFCGRIELGRGSQLPRMLLLGDELVLGRGSPAEPPSPGRLYLDDPLVSGQHARLRSAGERVVLEDLGSKNGTFLATRGEARRLTAPAALGDGALLFLGGHAFIYRLISALALEAIEEELRQPFAAVATASPLLAMVTHRLRRWAPGGGELIFVGETGVGKEVYARAVHAASGRRGELVAVNCAALPGELVESELFGYRPGAHSTARTAKAGLIEQAEGGTLFLDEVGDMPHEAQAKLLRFLQDRELVPLGGTRPRRLDVRVLAATNRPVVPGQAGGLRADLLGRLGAAPVLLPPLRERVEDLGALATHLLARAALPAAGAPFDAPAFRALFLYGWPLNVRELEKVLSSAAALAEGTRAIALRDLPPAFASTGAPSSRVAEASALRSGEAPGDAPAGRKSPEPGPSPAELEALLAQHQGNVADVSRALGRQRAAVWRWIKRFGLGPEKYREKPKE
jgi:DNA-binding NtrC family response regulator